MERMPHLAATLHTLSIAGILIAISAFAAPPQFRYHPEPPPPPKVIPQEQPVDIPEEYRQGKPQPLMRGDGFNYNLYYNYRLTPHLILRPNLQETTKPGAVNSNPHLFVGGLSAGINF